MQNSAWQRGRTQLDVVCTGNTLSPRLYPKAKGRELCVATWSDAVGCRLHWKYAISPSVPQGQLCVATWSDAVGCRLHWKYAISPSVPQGQGKSVISRQ
ncbi:hypothetical protein QE152_g1852 [Popillia japonica]|uniref:Uncharacterized protein n=1 Tax=Popillia japonica TaxID=7064 RepID=A0AAW1N380_POPJA